MDTIVKTLYPAIQEMGELSRSIPQTEHGFFHRNRKDTDRSRR